MENKVSDQIVQSPCSGCRKSRKHEIIHSHKESGNDDYHCEFKYMIIRCRGCGEISFRFKFYDYENAYPVTDDDWSIPTTIKTYPKFIEGHNPLKGTHCVPPLVKKIYEETLLAIQEKAHILAGLGLRGTVEAVCNEREINGKDLKVRISKLATKGWISTKDAERLHAIRFLGNDAAHEIKEPSYDQIMVALRIIEHLVLTVYILDDVARERLETMITSFEEFKDLLISKSAKFEVGEELPLAKFLGKDVRRIDGAISNMENTLISEISSGKFNYLSIGKVSVYANSPTALQHFVKN